ncbi:hypothetical protein COCVIDRAFT_95015 [Bipolaris victoriae FI3]|uniref:Uncharacterized protein n=1 Tax=Bipolaris victoriae (strain FI3) TaxID=930091 RepID=W7EDN5_BIPV3|nr:hypothetical protein COCVIDRAFT_95015 [Bipolaris victoriae FI3]
MFGLKLRRQGCLSCPSITLRAGIAVRSYSARDNKRSAASVFPPFPSASPAPLYRGALSARKNTLAKIRACSGDARATRFKKKKAQGGCGNPNTLPNDKHQSPVLHPFVPTPAAGHF